VGRAEASGFQTKFFSIVVNHFQITLCVYLAGILFLLARRLLHIPGVRALKEAISWVFVGLHRDSTTAIRVISTAKEGLS
jgi:hypothetical protein